MALSEKQRARIERAIRAAHAIGPSYASCKGACGRLIGNGGPRVNLSTLVKGLQVGEEYREASAKMVSMLRELGIKHSQMFLHDKEPDGNL